MRKKYTNQLDDSQAFGCMFIAAIVAVVLFLILDSI